MVVGERSGLNCRILDIILHLHLEGDRPFSRICRRLRRRESDINGSAGCGLSFQLTGVTAVIMGARDLQRIEVQAGTDIGDGGECHPNRVSASSVYGGSRGTGFNEINIPEDGAVRVVPEDAYQGGGGAGTVFRGNSEREIAAVGGYRKRMVEFFIAEGSGGNRGIGKSKDYRGSEFSIVFTQFNLSHSRTARLSGVRLHQAVKNDCVMQPVPG